MISLTAHGICNIIGGKLVSGPFDRVASGGVCTDSRHLPPHAVFFALGGEKFDGNLFAPEASRTAAAAVVSRVEEGMAPSCAVILVEDTLEALQRLAAWWRSELTLTVIGLTGSNGKTSTKDLTASVLSQGLRTIATQGNLNNQGAHKPRAGRALHGPRHAGQPEQPHRRPPQHPPGRPVRRSRRMGNGHEPLRGTGSPV